ncbi:MAG: DNA gyrase inhibitor YacG [Gammaproteobacteria bacterium]|nr:DNA gyrase inhibitor YacG [Gammaproteobacteria bacterium]
MSKKLHCPTCGKALTWDKNNPYRPFCSERCKLIDLGEWASESHRIPGDPVNPDLIDDKDKH